MAKKYDVNEFLSLINKKQKTQIAKAEPSQTQKVANEITYDWVAITKHPSRNKNFIATKLSTRKKAIDLAMMKCYKYVTNSLSKRGYNDCSLVNVYNEKNKNITQLVKKEPSQSIDFENYKNFKQWSILHKYDGRYFWNDSVNLNLKEAISESAIDCVTQIKRYSSNLRVSPKDCKLNTIQIVYINNKKKIFKPTNRKELNNLIANSLSLLDEKTVIAKAEPKQEQIKPSNIDNEAPVIDIAENITVNDSTYEIEGKVIDKSKKLFVQIDGETIPVKRGKFKIKRFSPVDEQLKIVALDQWGNKSKPKIVNITIDFKETELAEKLEQLNPSLIKSKSNKNRVALIIGIEKYEQTPAANFANLDAQYFYEYARKGFGIPKSNIKLLVDEDANLVKSISTINKWLPSKIKKNKTELIIFFAGHGLASNNGEELYILPQDSDPDLLSRTALSRTELFEQIISLSPKSVTMFMDTCYSGISRDEKMLLASARPIRIVADDQEGIPDNFTIFTASKLDQISSGLEEAKHGIFSYYLMKGLEGKADSNQDKKITNGELLTYMDENVSQKAAELGREQNPSLAGDPDKVLISYR